MDQQSAPPSPAEETATHAPKEHEQDLQLATRILAGERSAFAQLYEACAPALLRRLTRMTGSIDHAEDCLQQVFTEALRALPNYRGQGKLEAWLERIATHTAMGWYRKKYRWRSFVEQVVEQVTPEKSEPEQAALPEQLFLHEEMKTVVWQLLDRLSPRKRMALLLCDLEGHTIEDAAEQLGIPVGTAASRLFHARQEFRKIALAELRRQGLDVGDLFHD
ncbi:MAG: sigma-70 family RNA polymerase sigma factor [Myxococcales bacterium]|nr:sigma-70 family RNA polymerase sigma factor [Myxococcales bacterium]MCB9643269.1 sigma-70 family RNA polymerase sigma factor [Myxococcales bacterium]